MSAQDNLNPAQFTVDVHRGFGQRNTAIQQPLGRHWSESADVADKFAYRGVPDRPGDIDTAVVLHGKVHPAAVVNPKSKEGKDLIQRFGIWPDSSEKELTIRSGATVLVTGQTRKKTRKDKGGHVEWKIRKRTYNPPREMKA